MSTVNFTNARYDSELAIILQNSDLKLSEIICERMPIGIYTSVNVHTVNYEFSGLYPSGIQTRLISMGINIAEKYSAFFQALFSGLGIIDNQNLDKSTDQNELRTQILSHICKNTASRNQIELAFAKCTNVDLFIASDLSAIEMKIRESSLIIGTYRVAKSVKEVWPVIKAICIDNRANNYKC